MFETLGIFLQLTVLQDGKIRISRTAGASEKVASVCALSQKGINQRMRGI